MAIFQVNITGITNPIEVYGGLAAMKDYAGSSIGDGATAFTALANDSVMSQYLVAATRFIDRQGWQGLATGLAGGVATTLQFPRSGLSDSTGAPLDPTNVPALVVQAVFELGMLLADDPDIQSEVDSGSNLQSLGAGTARLQFFRPTSALDGNATVLPQIINQLVGQWLASADPAIAAASAGVSHGGRHSDFGGGDGPCWCRSSPCWCYGKKRNVNWPL